jgi:hypothetical protein
MYIYIYMCVYTTCTHVPVTVIRVGPPGCLFHTYFYNHARRLRLEKLLYLVLSRSPTVSEVKRPLRNHFGSETVTNI